MRKKTHVSFARSPASPSWHNEIYQWHIARIDSSQKHTINLPSIHPAVPPPGISAGYQVIQPSSPMPTQTPADLPKAILPRRMQQPIKSITAGPSLLTTSYSITSTESPGTRASRIDRSRSHHPPVPRSFLPAVDSSNPASNPRSPDITAVTHRHTFTTPPAVAPYERQNGITFNSRR